MRINRRVRQRTTNRLTGMQETELITGLTFGGGGPGFESTAATESAWWRHREALMASHTPLYRPWGYWEFEAKGYHPTAFVNGREPEVDALLRLELPLTARERATLEPAEPHWIPQTVPISGVDHWDRVVRSLETRRAWHEREGRQEQARAWATQAVLLRKRILEAKELKNGQV